MGTRINRVNVRAAAEFAAVNTWYECTTGTIMSGTGNTMVLWLTAAVASPGNVSIKVQASEDGTNYADICGPDGAVLEFGPVRFSAVGRKQFRLTGLCVVPGQTYKVFFKASLAEESATIAIDASIIDSTLPSDKTSSTTYATGSEHVDETEGTYSDYIDVGGEESATIQVVVSDGTPTISLHGTVQDDGTAAASCAYIDIGQYGFSSASGASTASTYTASALLYKKTGLNLKYIKVQAVVAESSTASWSILKLGSK